MIKVDKGLNILIEYVFIYWIFYHPDEIEENDITNYTRTILVVGSTYGGLALYFICYHQEEI